MWNLVQLMKKLGTHEQCLKFAEDNGLLPKTMFCSIHKSSLMDLEQSDVNVGYFRCRVEQCQEKSPTSRATGTCFENVNLCLPRIFYLMYCFVRRFTYESAILEDPFKNGTILSTSTIGEWYSYCREVVVLYQIDHQKLHGRIGGWDKVVQIDASQFENMKCEKGKLLNNQWVFGMTMDGVNDIRLAICSDCSSEVFGPLIQRHIIEGTTIRTDSWNVFDCLEDYGYIRRVVDFPDKSEQEGRAFENSLSSEQTPSKRKFISNLLQEGSCWYINSARSNAELSWEYMWRKSQKANTDLFLALVEVLKYAYTKM